MCPLGFSCRSACSPGSEKYTCYAAPFLGHAEEFHCAKNYSSPPPRASPVTQRPCRPLTAGRLEQACASAALRRRLHFTTCIYGPRRASPALAHSFLLSGCVRLPIHLLRRLSCACVPAFIKADRNTCVQVSMWT